MRRTVLLAAAIAAGCVPVAWAAKDPVAVFYDGAFYKSGKTVWQGNVFGRKACAKGRRVYIFRVRAGHDQRIGSTLSKASTNRKNFYPFSYVERGAARFGEYYARVNPTDSCKGARSAVMRGPG